MGVPDGWLDGVARRGGQTGWPNGGQTECPTGQTGWWTEGLFTFKRKMTCSVYVSCKSSSASDVFDAG
jgi:hypothetical protein